jgi:hypothetical protein
MPDINLIIQLITALLIAYVVWKTHDNAAGIKSVHAAVNSRLDQLVEEIRKNVFNQGVAEGRSQITEEQKRDSKLTGYGGHK